MLATFIDGARDIRVRSVPDPQLKHRDDAIVRVVAACVCGSDLWSYRGVVPVPRPRPIGHEMVGVVEATGPDVSAVRAGDFVIAPFLCSDGTCVNCRNGIQSSCVAGCGFGGQDAAGEPTDGCQGEYVRVPLANGTLVATPEPPDDTLVPALLSLADVMGTGHHAALSAGVGPGSAVVVVGDGAVGQCAVLAASRLGAERIVIMSRHADRQALARSFGATDVVEARGDEGVAAVRELLGGPGADAVLECVGTAESMAQALATARPGGRVGYVGVPHTNPHLDLMRMFRRNVGVAGGVAPARQYLPELMADVLAGRLDPSGVFDLELPLAQAADAYTAMDERRSIKTLLRP